MSVSHTREELLATLEHESAALLDLLPRFTDEQWRATLREDGWSVHDIAIHLADSNYGLALMVIGEFQPTLKLNETTGWLDADDHNEQRRQRNAALSRDKVMSRTIGAIDHARRALQTIDDLTAPGPYGAIHTKETFIQAIIIHTRTHRHDLEALLHHS